MESQEQKKESRKVVENEQNKAEGVEIIFYTDPLCCWSWGFEPQWRRLQYELQEQIVFRYVMTGLLASWKNFSDPLYSVSRPQQMGPVWMEAGSVSGMPMHHKLWVEDPPASSYPACIAVKSVQLQSPAAGIKYLRMLREAVMIRGMNIAKQAALTQVAEKLVEVYPGVIDVNLFVSDLTNDNGLEAFRRDWQETQNRNISRTPTLIMRSKSNPGIILTGYRPYDALLDAVEQIAPGIRARIKPISSEAYKNFWGSLTDRELAEIYEG